MLTCAICDVKTLEEGLVQLHSANRRAFTVQTEQGFLQTTVVIMSRSYGIKKDFSPRRDGEIFLQESTVASPPQSMSSYRSTMPTDDLHQHRGRGQHGKLNITSNDREDGFRSGKGGGSSRQNRDKSESTAREKEKKSRGAGWFGGKKKRRTEKVSDSIINGLEGRNMARVSPMLPIRSTMKGNDRDQFGRPHATPEEPDDEELRMKLSYDAPVDLSKGGLPDKKSSLLTSFVKIHVHVCFLLSNSCSFH